MVVVDVTVVRRARRGRRKVGGRVEGEFDGGQSTLLMLRVNMSAKESFAMVSSSLNGLKRGIE